MGMVGVSTYVNKSHYFSAPLFYPVFHVQEGLWNRLLSAPGDATFYTNVSLFNKGASSDVIRRNITHALYRLRAILTSGSGDKQHQIIFGSQTGQCYSHNRLDGILLADLIYSSTLSFLLLTRSVRASNGSAIEKIVSDYWGYLRNLPDVSRINDVDVIHRHWSDLSTLIMRLSQLCIDAMGSKENAWLPNVQGIEKIGLRHQSNIPFSHYELANWHYTSQYKFFSTSFDLKSTDDSDVKDLREPDKLTIDDFKRGFIGNNYASTITGLNESNGGSVQSFIIKGKHHD